MAKSDPTFEEYTRAVFQPRSATPLTGEDIRQITENAVGFFTILARWASEKDQTGKIAPAATAATPPEAEQHLLESTGSPESGRAGKKKKERRRGAPVGRNLRGFSVAQSGHDRQRHTGDLPPNRTEVASDGRHHEEQGAARAAPHRLHGDPEQR